MSLIHHVLLWEAKLKILARKRKALNIGGVASEAYIWVSGSAFIPFPLS